jgi:hypothetical protein
MGLEDNYNKIVNRALCGRLGPERPCKFRHRQLRVMSCLVRVS